MPGACTPQLQLSNLYGSTLKTLNFEDVERIPH
uniref:Uncharacterized protein n=1 Tax=Arundo donax TaxID=35708 RepID=A0A0A9HRB3_ARUDO